jgi:nucleotide-binding universal stress UspA family protein
MERVLVVVERGVEAPWVLDAAAELAAEAGSDVTLIGVEGVETQRFSPLPREETIEETRRAVEEAADQLRSRGVEAAVEPRAGRAVDAVLEVAEARDATLIVVGGSPRTPMVERLLGSLALELVQRAGRQVLVVTPPG